MAHTSFISTQMMMFGLLQNKKRKQTRPCNEYSGVEIILRMLALNQLSRSTYLKRRCDPMISLFSFCSHDYKKVQRSGECFLPNETETFIIEKECLYIQTP